MENKLFRLRYNKVRTIGNYEYWDYDSSGEYWDYDSSGENFITHWVNLKGRYINGNYFGIELIKYKLFRF